MRKISFSITDLICCGDEKILTTKLKVNPHIVDAVVNFANNLATITYHEENISAKQIKSLIADCGFHCSRIPPLLSSKEALAIADHKIAYQEKSNQA
ncbi:MAG: heavy-metal-associated domain-containing protein [Patescibacteria group bacterium]|nr:heavy-metal-associated domain-containing protein [Patescibacteria group bacterium]